MRGARITRTESTRAGSWNSMKKTFTFACLPPEHLFTVELSEKVAAIAVVPSVDRNVRVPPAIVSVPGGFATLVPPDNEPPAFVKPP